MFKLIFILLLPLLCLQSCKTYSDEEIEEFDDKIKEYLTGNNKFTRSESGLYYHIIQEGELHKTKFTDSVLMTYTGKLLNGNVFEKQDNPIQFAVRDLIEGWKEGLMYCGQGSEIEIIIPPQLGYGNNELDKIPANSILLYTIKVIEIK